MLKWLNKLWNNTPLDLQKEEVKFEEDREEVIGEPKYRIYQINERFVIARIGGSNAAFSYLKLRDKTLFDYKEDSEIWFYSYDHLDDKVARFASLDGAKSTLYFYLNGGWKKPTFQLVYEQ
jgi:hypothetical protein